MKEILNCCPLSEGVFQHLLTKLVPSASLFEYPIPEVIRFSIRPDFRSLLFAEVNCDTCLLHGIALQEFAA